MNQRKQGHKGPDFRMILEVTEPEKNDDQWEVTAVATVLYHRQHAPDPSKEVIFSLDGVEVERISTDSEGGQTTATINLPKAKSYLLTAFLADQPGVRNGRKIVVKKPEEKKKTPASVIVTFAGERGKQILMIAVSTEDGSFIPNFTGKIMNGYKFEKFTTGSDGTCEYKTNFREKERAFRIWVGSKPDQIWSNVLLGPKGGK